jgi:hypothetical protein
MLSLEWLHYLPLLFVGLEIVQLFIFLLLKGKEKKAWVSPFSVKIKGTFLHSTSQRAI